MEVGIPNWAMLGNFVSLKTGWTIRDIEVSDNVG
jgi:hypothetical protein